MSIDDKLSQIFDVEPIAVTAPVTQEITPLAQVNQALESDFETSRSNLHSLLAQGQDALYHALEVAKQSEHPRAFEVVGGLVKHLSDINTQLLDLHKRKQTIDGPTNNSKKEATSVTNNAIYVGSTSDLSKMLNDLRKGK
jgi:hypothetical protein